MSAIDLAAALEAVRLGEATGEHAAVLAAELERLRHDTRLMMASALNERDCLTAELAYLRSPATDPGRSMVDDPRIGDVWRWDGTIAKRVVAVLPPLEEGDDPRIALDGDERPTHVGWWIGQGYEPYEPAESVAARAELATVRAERDAALSEQRRAVARLAEVSAERDRFLAQRDAVAAEVDRLHAEISALEEERERGWAEQASAVRAERDRLRAVVIAQAKAWDRAETDATRNDGDPFEDAAWLDATEDTEALGRELRGAR